MTTSTLSEAQLTLKAKFDEIDIGYQTKLQNNHDPERTALARIKAYSQAYIEFVNAKAQLGATR